jgi:isocitrate/isopropylmalate dehydrogenase
MFEPVHGSAPDLGGTATTAELAAAVADALA